LGTVYLKKEQYANAEHVFRESLQIYTAVLPAGHLNTAVAQIKLGRSLVRQQRYEEAEECTKAGYEVIVKQASPTLNDLQAACDDLIQIYDALHEPEKAAKYRAALPDNQSNKSASKN